LLVAVWGAERRRKEEARKRKEEARKRNGEARKRQGRVRAVLEQCTETRQPVTGSPGSQMTSL
jgi:hypothetical protein